MQPDWLIASKYVFNSRTRYKSSQRKQVLDKMGGFSCPEVPSVWKRKSFSFFWEIGCCNLGLAPLWRQVASLLDYRVVLPLVCFPSVLANHMLLAVFTWDKSSHDPFPSLERMGLWQTADPVLAALTSTWSSRNAKLAQYQIFQFVLFAF